MENFGRVEDNRVSLKNDGTVTSEGVVKEVQVYFLTNLPEKFQLPQQPFIIPQHFRRLDLSKLINKLLHESQQLQDDYSVDGETITLRQYPFDFLVDGEFFLRTSLEEYMNAHGITAEVPINLHYQLAVRKLKEQQLPRSPDWISSVASFPREGLLIEACYDGCCRVHRPAVSDCATSSVDGAADAGAAQSSLVGDMRLSQGPLTAVAAVFEGAYLPAKVIQVLLGSKGGGYNVVRMWEEKREFQRESEGDEYNHSRGFSNENEDLLKLEATPSPLWKGVQQSVGCQGDEVTSLGVSADGVTVATGGGNGKIALWDNVPDMKMAAALETERRNGSPARTRTDNISNAAAPPEGHDPFLGTTRRKRKCLQYGSLGGSSGGPMRMREAKFKLEGHTDSVTDLCFASQPYRCVLYSGSLDNTICAWDTLVCGPPLSVWAAPNAVTSLCSSPVDGRILCSAHEDGRTRLWDVRSGSRGPVDEIHKDSPQQKRGMATSPDANSRLDLRLAFGCPHQRFTTQARWCRAKGGENLIATVGQDGTLRLLDLRSAAMPLLILEVGEHASHKIMDEEKLGNVPPRKFLPVRLLTCAWLDRHRIAAGGSDGRLRVFTVETPTYTSQ